MKNADMNNVLEKAMSDFADAYNRLKITIDRYEQTTGTSVNNLQNFVDNFPFEVSFDELPIQLWVDTVIEGLNKPNYKVLDYQYLNTGGSTMVGIHRVWLTEEKKVVYVYTNEEGSTISTVDYIRDDLPIDDYDEFMMDVVDWGRITGSEKYFELYRYCYNQYLVDDCKYFGIKRGVMPHLLSDELQKTIDVDYYEYIMTECGGLFETNGRCIFVDTNWALTHADRKLQEIKNWKQWHDTLPGDDIVEKMYEESYQITLAGKTVRIPFDANAFSLVDELLKETIKEW